MADIESTSNPIEKHDWFVFKDDAFRSCRKCGCIESINATNGVCPGKVKVELRNESLLEKALAQEPKVPTCRTHYGQHDWQIHEETGVEFCKTCAIRRDVWEKPSLPENTGNKHVPEQLKPTLWKPGESGNPAGRPKGSKNLTTIVMEALRAKKLTVTLPDGSKAVLTGEQAFAEAVLENAIKKKDRESLRMIWEMNDGKPTQQHKLEVNGPKGYEVDPAREAMILDQFDAYDGDLVHPSKALESSVSLELAETTQSTPAPQNATPTPIDASEVRATTNHATDIPPIITQP